MAVDANANRYTQDKGKDGILSDRKASEIDFCVAVNDSAMMADSNDKRYSVKLVLSRGIFDERYPWQIMIAIVGIVLSAMFRGTT